MHDTQCCIAALCVLISCEGSILGVMTAHPKEPDMAFFTENAATVVRPARILALFDKLGAVLSRLAVAQNRADTVHKLQALSDPELAALGLNRADIIRHVYRDIYYI